jgi:HEAT repeat protein
MQAFLRILSASALAAALAGGAAFAAPLQLDLPDHGPRKSVDAEGGVELRSKPTGDLAPKAGPKVVKPPLDVGPGAAQPAQSGPQGPTTPGGAPGAQSGAEEAPAWEPGAASASGAVLDLLRTIENADDPRLFDAGARLIEQGPAGLSAARAALHGDGVGLVLGGARVLLAAGAPADHELVVQRLRRKLPTRASAALLTLLAERDPVRASPELLISLFDHPQGQLREAAAKRLVAVVAPEHVPVLAARLRAGSSETRRLVLDALARVSDPSARNLLLDSLSDSSAKVAARAAQLLANDDGAEADLLAAAFPVERKARPARRTAYSRIALVEREDRRAAALVGEDRVPELLADLASDDPLERGAAALLLSGIGFRAEGSRGFAWLDRAVPHELVRTLAGDEFHRDFSSIAAPAQRRMALLSGQTLGADGAAWQAWWIDSYGTFRAHRAVLDVADDDLLALSVRFKDGPPTLRVLRFLGPDVAPDDPSAPVVGRTIRLTAAQASDLARRLAQEGVFGAERLPSPSVAFTAASRELEVRLREQAKRFVVPAVTPDGQDGWLDRLARTFVALDEESRWQRYPAGVDPAAFWLAEAPWWDQPRTDEARDARLKELVLADLLVISTFERGPDLDELERLAERGALQPTDFQPLIRMLVDERYYGDRVPRLVALAIGAARGENGRIPPDLAGEMVGLLAESYPAEAEREVVDVLLATEPEVTRAAARSEAPLLRALAAAGLAKSGAPEDKALLHDLLSDPSPDVEAAAVLAHAEAGLREAGDDLLFRARMSEPRVRSAALRAIGVLRLDGALDALVQALADPSQVVQIAAAEGLADLSDAQAAPLLVSLLGRGSRSPVYEAAARGLRVLGEGAHEALLRSARAPGGSASRDAALLLSEDLVPDAAPVLMRLLQADPGDARVAGELGVLTCADMRGESDPVRAWARWWATVVHDDSLAWFRAACERAGAPAPPAEAFAGAGTRSARLFLVERMGSSENDVVEHARRRYRMLAGGDLGALPTRGPLRDAFLAELRERLVGGER